MPREPKPWFWKQRGQWVVNIGRIRHYLGPDRKAAFEEFYRLMRRPPEKRNASTQSVARGVKLLRRTITGSQFATYASFGFGKSANSNS